MRTRYLWILALAVMLGGGAARADTGNLSIGGTFNYVPTSVGDEGGGSVTVSTLNGVTLNWLYCVDLNDVVYVPGTYNNTTITSNGMANENGAFQTVNNAGEVAWLLDHYANSANGDTNAEVALQAAIWNVIYGVGLNPSSVYYNSTIGTDYNNDLNGLGSAPLSTVLWISPGDGSGTIYQGLAGSVPDGGLTLMLLGGALVGLEALRRVCRV
ncbi:MAG: Cys-Gln thioester bond-forming surface protein [Terriglobia bacterium]